MDQRETAAVAIPAAFYKVLTVTFAEGTTPAWSVRSAVGGKTVSYTDSVADGVVTRTYILV